MNLIIFEDEGYKNFLPLTWTRPVYELRCGINTLAEKILRQYSKVNVDYSCRYYLPGAKLMKFEKGLFINGRVIPHMKFAKDIPLKGKDEIFCSGDEIVAIRAVSRNFDEVKKKAKVKKVKVKVVKYPWDLIAEVGSQITEDSLSTRLARSRQGKKHKSVIIYNPKHVIIDAGAEVEAGTVIDARQGPVYIGEGTIVKALSYLGGPLSVGPECRIGGEVSSSIIHGYSNKGHYGFIGHSYIGEWVNLGAGTTNSNLKNNYGSVKVEINGKKVDSGKRFVGCFIGDHAKTGIGTLIATGATIGVGANVFGGGVAPKNVPSFSWGNNDRYRLEDFLKSAKIVMQRRGKKLSKQQQTMIAGLYKSSSRKS